jgi:hypothetical protein
MASVAMALATFQRTMIAFATPFDRYGAGRKDAISAEAHRGYGLFQGPAAEIEPSRSIASSKSAFPGPIAGSSPQKICALSLSCPHLIMFHLFDRSP